MRTKSWPLLLFLSFIVEALTLPGLAQQVIATVPVGAGPGYVGANPATNKIYVSNGLCDENQSCGAGTVTVIDGASNQTATINVGVSPGIPTVNTVTNKIYIANGCGNSLPCGTSTGSVTVIDGVTNNTSNVNVGYYPSLVAVNPVSNRIYVANNCGNDPNCNSPGTVSVIDGNSNSLIATILAGFNAFGVALNPVTNKIYVTSCGSDPSCVSDGEVTVIDGATNNATSVGVGVIPYFVAVNPVTNKIYVANTTCSLQQLPCPAPGTVTVIDGATNGTTTLNLGAFAPFDIAVNPVTNKIYVVNTCGNDPNCAGVGTVSVIDGATNNATPVNVGSFPFLLAADSVTNTIYVVDAMCNKMERHVGLGCSNGPGAVTAIDGATNSTVTVGVGAGPFDLAVNATTNRIYVPNYADNTTSVIAGASAAPLQFVSVIPCRLVDTRPQYGGNGPIQGGTAQSFVLPQRGNCGIPTSAAAYSLNVTVVPPGRLGFLTIWPTGEDQPIVSTMNSLDGRIKANAAIVPAGYQGAVSVYVNDTSNVLLDIDGYFTVPGSSTLQFYTLTPCRIVDTRNANGLLAGPFLNANQERDFPVLESPCIPTGVTPAAYSFNVTVVPHPTGQRLGFLTVWPQGETQPTVSTLNNLTGTIVANAAVVPAGTNGGVAVYPNNDTDLLIDINGYFAAPGAGGLSLYPVAPCRVLDTRGSDGNGPPFMGEKTVNVIGSVCAPPATAQAYVLNATVVPPVRLGFLALWANGEQQPMVSTLNAIDGAITSNMAIVPTTNGLIDAYANNLTQLILDISSYFAP